MADWLKSPDGYFMYVAPSSALLREVQNYLRRLVPSDKHSLIELIDSKSGARRVVSRINDRLNGVTSKFGTEGPAPVGTVLLITHAAFLLLKSIPQSSKIHLIFDEARKCITQHVGLSLTDEQRTKVFKWFNMSSVNATFYKATAKLDPDVVRDKIKKLKLRSDVTDRLLELVEATENPRLEVFLSKDTKADTFEVILPSILFDGFKSVTLMSAFFEDSQMYHLLKKRKVAMTDITEVSLQNYRYRTSKIKERYSKIDLVTLCPDVDTVLSKAKLSGMLVSLEHESKIFKALNAIGVYSVKDLIELRNKLKTPGFKPNSKVQRFKDAWTKNPNHLVLNPADWLVHAAAQSIQSWAKRNKLVHKPLVVLNAKQRDLFTPKLPQFHVETTNLHGLNEYQGHNVVAFLAAVNPSKKMVSFYNKYLPGYDQAKDHVAEVCVQCVCRISIRDIKAKARALVIVPDNGIATLLSHKLSNRPVARADLSPSLSMVFGRLQWTPTSVVKPKTDKERVSTWLQDPVNRVIQNLRSKIVYYKKVGSPKLEETERILAKIIKTRVVPESLAVSKYSPRKKYV